METSVYRASGFLEKNRCPNSLVWRKSVCHKPVSVVRRRTIPKGGPRFAVISRPAFNPYYTVYSLGSDGVVLLSDDEPQLLRGRLYTLVVPLIDGRRTVEEIVSALAGQCSPAEVYFVLYRLEQKGYLIDQDAPPAKALRPGQNGLLEGQRAGCHPD